MRILRIKIRRGIKKRNLWKKADLDLCGGDKAGTGRTLSKNKRLVASDPNSDGWKFFDLIPTVMRLTQSEFDYFERRLKGDPKCPPRP